MQNFPLHVRTPPECPQSVTSPAVSLLSLGANVQLRGKFSALPPLTVRLVCPYDLTRHNSRPVTGDFCAEHSGRRRGRVWRPCFLGSRPTEGSPEGRRAFSAEIPGCRPAAVDRTSRHPEAWHNANEALTGVHPGVRAFSAPRGVLLSGPSYRTNSLPPQTPLPRRFPSFPANLRVQLLKYHPVSPIWSSCHSKTLITHRS